MNSFIGTISEKSIIEQVEKICNNSDFKSKELLCRFLRFIVTESLAGRGDEIKGYTIGVEVLGKDKDFDPDQDSLVRIHAGRLRRLLKMYYLENGTDDFVRIEIPKGGYKPEFKNNNLEEFQLDKNDRFKKEFGDSALEPTITILPFKNLTGDPAKDYFAHGFSEELSIELTKYEDLKVINCWNRPESNQLNNSDMYAKYKTRFLVDGSVLKKEQQIKIHVKLLDTLKGNQIWAESYLRDLEVENLFQIEEEISDSIAKTIGGEIGLIFELLTKEANRLKPKELDVFKATLHFYYYEAHQSTELAGITFRVLNQALSIEPDSGIVKAMLATMYGTFYALDFPHNDGALDKMAELADQALALDPKHQLVKITQVFKCFLLDQKTQFDKEANDCLSMNLHSPARLGALGFYISLYGGWETGKPILDKALNKNIGYPLFFHGATCLYYYRIHEYKRAMDEAYKYDIPGLFWAPMLRAACLGQLDRLNEAKEQLLQLYSLKPDFETKAEYLISRFVKEDELVKHLIEGLEKCGMQFP